MEIRLDAAEGQQLPGDCFLSMRVGDMQKQSRFAPSRTYKFPEATDPKSHYGRIEVFQRVGHVTMNLDSFEKAEKHVQVPFVGGLSHLKALSMKCSVKGMDANRPRSEKRSRKKERLDAAQAYLQDHRLEELLADAMREVIHSKPKDPHTFLSNLILQRAPRHGKAVDFGGPALPPVADAAGDPLPVPPEPLYHNRPDVALRSMSPVSLNRKTRPASRDQSQKLPPLSQQAGPPLPLPSSLSKAAQPLFGAPPPAEKSAPPPQLAPTPAQAMLKQDPSHEATVLEMGSIQGNALANLHARFQRAEPKSQTQDIETSKLNASDKLQARIPQAAVQNPDQGPKSIISLQGGALSRLHARFPQPAKKAPQDPSQGPKAIVSLQGAALSRLHMRFSRSQETVSVAAMAATPQSPKDIQPLRGNALAKLHARFPNAAGPASTASTQVTPMSPKDIEPLRSNALATLHARFTSVSRTAPTALFQATPTSPKDVVPLRGDMLAKLHMRFPQATGNATAPGSITRVTTTAQNSQFQKLPSVGSWLAVRLQVDNSTVTTSDEALQSFAMLPSVGTWLQMLPQQEPEVLAPPTLPATTSFKFLPSVGSWLALPPMAAPEVEAQEMKVDVVDKGNFALTPSVGTWLAPLPPTAAPEVEAQEMKVDVVDKVNFALKPSVGTWLAPKPTQISKPWYLNEGAGDDSKVHELQLIIADREAKLEKLQRCFHELLQGLMEGKAPSELAAQVAQLM